MDIKFKATRTDQTDPTFKNSTSWSVKITTPLGSITRPYHMGAFFKGQPPTLNQVLESLFGDARAVQDRSVSEFMADYGYEEYRHALKAFKACDRTAKRLGEIFTPEEYKALETSYLDM